jgi:hypothetical protein
MQKSKIVVTGRDEQIKKLVGETDHRVLATWAADCVERVLPYFEEKYEEDKRPRKAIEAIRAWVRTGVFKMADVRGISLASHAAARGVENDKAACSVARAAGQAMATAHVPTHSIAAAAYAVTAIRDASDSVNTDDAVNKERQWQYRRLVYLREDNKQE